MKSFIKYTLIAVLLINNTHALSLELPSCQKNIIMNYTHLKDASFQERFYMNTKLEELLASKTQDAYSLSLPLLVSAQLGNIELYQGSLSRINQAMEQLEASPFKAWIYGRMIFAAHSIKDVKTEAAVSAHLYALTSQLIKDEASREDRFTVWALGYSASLNESEYNNAKDLLKNGADALTNKFLSMSSQGATEEKLQEARSDALWAWVLNMQAAANNEDDVFYEYCVEQMQIITQQSTLSDALTKGLLRTSASNDYPAWAIGIASLASLAMDKNDQTNALKGPLNTAIMEARNGNYVAESLLAMVNSQLTVERAEAIKQCPPQSRL